MANGNFGGGDGTASSPYIIEDIFDLDNLRGNAQNNHYALANDINMSIWPFGSFEGWEPMDGFRGHLDGRGCVLRGLYINRPSETYVGLFGDVTASSSFRNIGFEDLRIYGGKYAGALAGRVHDSTIAKCYAKGMSRLYGNAPYFGALVGYLHRGKVELSYSRVKTDFEEGFSGNYFIGGIAGYGHSNSTSTSLRAIIEQCYSSGEISGQSDYTLSVFGSISSASFATVTSCSEIAYDKNGQATEDSLLSIYSGAFSSSTEEDESPTFEVTYTDFPKLYWEEHGIQIPKYVFKNKNGYNKIKILRNRSRDFFFGEIDEEDIGNLNGHTDNVYSAVFSPDGTKIVSGSGGSSNNLRIWNAETGEDIRTLSGHPSAVRSVAFSPDGTKIVSGSHDRSIRIWDTETGAHIRTLSGHTNQVWSVAFSPDGTKIVSGSDDQSIRIWNAQTGAHIRTLTGHGSSVQSVAFSPDGTKIVSGDIGTSNNIRIWNAETGALVRILTHTSRFVYSVAFSPDGTKIVSGSSNDSDNLRIWDIETGQLIRTLSGHTNHVYSVAFSPDGTKTVSGDLSGFIRIWNAETGALIRTLSGHTGWVRSVAFSPDGTRIVSGSQDSTARIWDAETGDEEINISTGFSSNARCADISPDRKIAVIGSTGAVNNLALADPVTRKVLANLEGHTHTISSLSVSPDETIIASGSHDRTIRIWDAKTGRQIKKLEGHTSNVNSVKFFPDGIHIASGSNDSTLRIWNIITGENINTISIGSTVNSVSIAPDGQRIAVGLSTNSNHVRIYDARSGEEIRSFSSVAATVLSVDFSPDGNRIIASSNATSNNLREWDVETGVVIRTITAHSSGVSSAKYSPDGQKIISTANRANQNLRVWDVGSFSLISDVQGHSANVSYAEFSKDGSKIISCGSTGDVWIHETENWSGIDGAKESNASVLFGGFISQDVIAAAGADRAIRLYKNAESLSTALIMLGHTNQVRSVAFSPGGTRIASGDISGSNNIRIWNSETGALIRTLTGHTNTIWSVAFSPDGTRIVSGSAGSSNNLRIWDVGTGAHIRTLIGHTNNVYSVAFSPDGTRIASGSADNTIRIWDAETGALIRALNGHTSAVWSATFSPDGTKIVSGSNDNSIRIWNWETGAHIGTLSGHTSPVLYVAFSPDGTKIVSGSSDQSIRIWDSETGALIRTLSGHSSSVHSVAFSPDGTRIVSGSVDRSIRIWDAEAGVLIRTLSGHTNSVYSVAFSPDGTRIASGSADQSIRIWNWESHISLEKERDIAGHSSDVNSVRFSHDGKSFVTASSDNSLILWDADNKSSLRTLSGHTSAVHSAVFSPDGAKMVSGSADNTVRIWDAETGASVRTLIGHSHTVFSVAFSPNGTKIISGSLEGNIRIWEAETGDPIKTLTGHGGWVYSTAFSPDGTRIVSGSVDRSIRIWDAEAGVLIRTLSGHTSAVWSATFSPDGMKIISGSHDSTVRIWDASTGDLLHTHNAGTVVYDVKAFLEYSDTPPLYDLKYLNKMTTEEVEDAQRRGLDEILVVGSAKFKGKLTVITNTPQEIIEHKIALSSAGNEILILEDKKADALKSSKESFKQSVKIKEHVSEAIAQKDKEISAKKMTAISNDNLRLSIDSHQSQAAPVKEKEAEMTTARISSSEEESPLLNVESYGPDQSTLVPATQVVGNIGSRVTYGITMDGGSTIWGFKAGEWIQGTKDNMSDMGMTKEELKDVRYEDYELIIPNRAYMRDIRVVICLENSDASSTIGVQDLTVEFVDNKMPHIADPEFFFEKIHGEFTFFRGTVIDYEGDEVEYALFLKKPGEEEYTKFSPWNHLWHKGRDGDKVEMMFHHKDFGIGDNDIKIVTKDSRGAMNEQFVRLNVYNEGPMIHYIQFSKRGFRYHVSDPERDKLSFRVFINDKEVVSWTKFMKSPIEGSIRWPERSMYYGVENKVTFEVRDHLGKQSVFESKHVGEFNNIVFRGINGELFSDDRGGYYASMGALKPDGTRGEDVLHKFEIPPLIGETFSLPIPIIISNESVHDLKDPVLWVEQDMGHPDVFISEGNEPFEPQKEIMIPGEFPAGGQRRFYIQSTSDRKGEYAGIFYVYVKAKLSHHNISGRSDIDVNIEYLKEFVEEEWGAK